MVVPQILCSWKAPISSTSVVGKEKAKRITKRKKQGEAGGVRLYNHFFG